MNSRFAVIGLGRFGSKIARYLSLRGAEVIAIDEDAMRVDALKDDVAHAVQADATHLRSLESLRIKDMDAVIVAIGENFEALLLSVVNLLELKVNRIISRTASEHQTLILQRIGITEIFNPEEEVGQIVAERLIHPNVKTFLQLPDDFEIVELSPPRSVCNKTVGEIRFSEDYNLNLITIKRPFEVEKDKQLLTEYHLLGVPQKDLVVYERDALIVLGKQSDIERFIEFNS
ncbi:MAG: TrkA family potassium uptake protein [Bacteroidetes bacterium]|nr:TrkA family potassium uptake protein [Bacteroidota bacterium]